MIISAGSECQNKYNVAEFMMNGILVILLIVEIELDIVK